MLLADLSADYGLVRIPAGPALLGPSFQRLSALADSRAKADQWP